MKPYGAPLPESNHKYSRRNRRIEILPSRARHPVSRLRTSRQFWEPDRYTTTRPRVLNPGIVITEATRNSVACELLMSRRQRQVVGSQAKDSLGHLSGYQSREID